MFEPRDSPHWPDLLRPLASASTALGRLAHALEITPLHQAWLWRETARIAARISQITGYRIRTERLLLDLVGLPGGGVPMAAGWPLPSGFSWWQPRCSAPMFMPTQTAWPRAVPATLGWRAATGCRPPAGRR